MFSLLRLSNQVTHHTIVNFLNNVNIPFSLELILLTLFKSTLIVTQITICSAPSLWNSLLARLYNYRGGLLEFKHTLYVTFDSINNRVYVTNIDNDTVSVIDVSTNTVIGTINVGNAPDSITFDSSNNRVYVVNSDDDTVSVIDASGDILYCDQPESYYDNVIIGTDSSEILTGTSQNDLILGYGGDDSIKGGAGDDCIYAGDGNDVVIANAGNDIIYGESGNDALFGNNGADTIYGGEGNDIIWGQAGIDSIDAGNGNDMCVAIAKDTILSCEITS